MLAALRLVENALNGPGIIYDFTDVNARRESFPECPEKRKNPGCIPKFS